MSYNEYGVSAAKEYLLSGQALTRLEAMVIFGVPDLTKIISDLRRSGFAVNKRVVTYAEAMRRVNMAATLKPPPSLPIREITLTDYWLSR
jgi:hypothetical protein